MPTLSNTQVDRLGERLKSGPATDDDLVILDEFRRSFAPAYEVVIERIRELKLEPTGRLPKSTPSIIEKLKRETIRLTQIQDIAGCRIVLPNTAEQNRILESLQSIFPGVVLVDRRAKPQHGYRAVHLVVRVSSVPVEIQVRTLLQHKWAELSEKLADVLDSSIKYGGGPDVIKRMLTKRSDMVAELEGLDYTMYLLSADLNQLSADERKSLEGKFHEIEGQIAEHKKSIADSCEDFITWLITRKSSS